MADRADILLHLYSEERAQARQSEDQRATLTNIILVVVAAGLGFVTSRGEDNSEAALVVSVSILALGTFGAIATGKYFERWLRHWRRSYAIQAQLFELHPDIDANLKAFSYASLQERTDPYEAEIEERFPLLSRVRLFRLWVTFHCAIALMGAIMAVIFLVLVLT